MIISPLYEHHAGGSITTGLSADQPYFTLNNKNITLYSGAMHYFRVPQEYWRDNLRKMRAAGLNTVETYVPWNLHEPQPGVFDFGAGGTEFQEFLNIEKFLRMAQEEDLLAIVRPGPYICSEWEFGGMPSWLLRERNIKVRTSDPKFMKPVARFFQAVLAILSTLQFTKGGPIIAFQIENEYGNVNEKNADYLEMLKKLFTDNGIVEMLFTSDSPLKGTTGTIPGILQTANFQNDSIKEMNILKQRQPNKPVMVMEYWSGWYDRWTDYHHTTSVSDFMSGLNNILQYPASVNFYMFQGGTNWGFMNGAKVLDENIDNGAVIHVTSSYDYNAPLTEAGDYTDKYKSLSELIKKHNGHKTRLPNKPHETKKVAYAKIKVTHMLPFVDLLQQTAVAANNSKLLPMEWLDINNKSGQSYGYITYRTIIDLPANSNLTIKGRVCDTLMMLINGKLATKVIQEENDLNGFGYWRAKDASIDLQNDAVKAATVDLIVENWGRINIGFLNQFNQLKGLWQGDVLINDDVIEKWDIFPLEFKKQWTTGLNGWKDFKDDFVGPALYKAALRIHGVPHDTFVDMRHWKKGILVVNGFVLSRYFRLGPQQTAYLPAPFLRQGDNEVLVFEHFHSGDSVHFSQMPVFEMVTKMP